MSLETELLTIAAGDHGKAQAMLAAVMEIAARPTTEVSLGREWIDYSVRKRGRCKQEDPDDAQAMFDEWMRVHGFTDAELRAEIRRPTGRDRTESLGEFRVRYLRERGVYEGPSRKGNVSRVGVDESSLERIRQKTRTVQADVPGTCQDTLAGSGPGTLADRF